MEISYTTLDGCVMAEEILGRIDGSQRHKDVVGTQTYNLVFTRNRMIAELLGDTGVSRLLFGYSADLIGKRRNYNKAIDMHQQKTPNQILSDNKKNFEIKYEDIDKIILKEIYKTFLFHIKFFKKIKKVGIDILFEVPEDRREEVELLLLRIFPNKASLKEKKKGNFF